MSVTGIGAAVRRKEDRRFVTGKGHFTADINLPAQAHACFLRSPHGRAKLRKSTPWRIPDAGGARGTDRRRTRGRQDRGADLRLDDQLQGRLADEVAPHPAMAHGTANHVGDAVAVVVAETLSQAKDAAEKIKVDYEVLTAADPAKAQAKGAPQIHEVAPKQHDLPVAPRRPAAPNRRSRPPSTSPARSRQQPAGAERHRASRGHRRIRSRHRQPHALEHDPKSACRASGHLGFRRHRART